MHRLLLDTSRKAIPYKLDIDMDKVYEAMKLLLKLLKPKYANRFYFSENKVSTYMDLNDDENIKLLKAYHYHFFGDDMIYIYGVIIEYKNNRYEYSYYNMVDKIPIAFKSQGDNDIYKLKNMINEINSSIEAELRKILNKDDKYIDSINKQIADLRAVKTFQNTFNKRLSNSNIIKRTAKKVQLFYKHKPLEIFAYTVRTMYSTVEVGIWAKIEPFVYDRCLDVEFKKDSIYLGNLSLDYNGKHKFKPAFENSKYFTNEITSIKYMRNTFKKYLIAEVLDE